MREIPAADRCRWRHGEVFSQKNTGVSFTVEQSKQCRFLCVVRAGRVAWRWTNALILFLDQSFVVQLLIGCVAPEIFTNDFVHTLSERLRKAVSQSFHHDAVVIIVVGIKFVSKFFCFDACGHNKAAHVVFHCFTVDSTFWRNEIGQRVVRLTGWLVGLLAKLMQSRYLFIALRAEHNDIVIAALIRWPEADNTARVEQFLINNALKHRLGVFEQVGCGFADHFVFENTREFTRQFPRHKERRPVDVIHQLGQIEIFVNAQAELVWLRRMIVRPVCGECVLAGLFVWQ